MLWRARLLLVLIVITAPVIFGSDSEDDVIRDCREKSEVFAATEDQYTRKGPRGPSEPGFFEPQFKPLKIEAFNKEREQRPFLCITDALKGSLASLEGNQNYQDLVQECKSKQTQPKCDPDYPYRMINGTCNNLDHPEWGSVLSCAARMIDASYEGADGFRKSKCGGKDLPDPRYISREYMYDVPQFRWFTSSHVPYFGQFIAHDISDAPVTFVEDKHLACCRNDTKDKHPQCAPIIIQPTDTFYVKHGVDCLNIIRTAPCPTCEVGKKNHMNEPTDYIDLSQVYGLWDEKAMELKRKDGKLYHKHSKAGELLPDDETIEPFRCGAHLPGSTEGRKKRDLFSVPPMGNGLEEGPPCFKAGDRRVNQHTPLMIFHTVYMREHNRICGELAKLNPQWDGEKIYQEARKINIAQFQVVIYKEFLPHILKKYMADYDLYLRRGRTTEYEPDLNPTILTEFSSAAYRLHSMIESKVGYQGPTTSIPDSSQMRHLFQDHSALYKDKIEEMIQHTGTWPYQWYDSYVVHDVSRYTLKERSGSFGYDIAAVNIQRGRDNGLPPYVDVVRFISGGKIDIKDWDDLVPYMKMGVLLRLKKIYCHVGDIDLWVGLNSELKEPGMGISTTAAKIIAEQFRRLRFGDRFWFENPGQFTDEQRLELLNASLSRTFCDTTKIKELPKNSMEFPGSTNMVTLCEELPKVDLSKWKEW